MVPMVKTLAEFVLLGGAVMVVSQNDPGGCPRRCSQCTDLGVCTECQDGYWGRVCEPCPEYCESRKCSMEGLCYRCIDGRYGHKCERQCASYCLKCTQPNGICLNITVNLSPGHCPEHCAHGCTEERDCKGCLDGRYGVKCEHKCSWWCSQCSQINGTCQDTVKTRADSDKMQVSPLALAVIWLAAPLSFILLIIICIEGCVPRHTPGSPPHLQAEHPSSSPPDQCHDCTIRSQEMCPATGKTANGSKPIEYNV